MHSDSNQLTHAALRPSRALERLPLVVIDFETTGLFPNQGDRIIELGAVHIDGLQIQRDSAYHALVNPLRLCSPEAFKVHGIPDALLAEQPPIQALLPEFMHFLGRRVLVGQNIAFDISFLARALRECGLPPLTAQTLDTRWMSQLLFPQERHHSLDAIASRLGLSRPTDRHRALGDVLLTAEILVRLLDLCQGKGLNTLDAVLAAHDRQEGGLHSDPQLQGVLEQGFQQRRTLQLVYSAAGRDRASAATNELREVNIFHFAPPYFIGYCFKRKSIRTFRVDRVAKASLLDEPYEIPNDFHPQDHFQRWTR